MTVNYKDSSGVDLDSIFAVTNSNAGSIGYLTSSGQDLGNRYPSGSLGYSVGYKNSAGTDIGYLRTYVTAPSQSSHSAPNTVTVNGKNGCSYSCTDSEGAPTTCSRRTRHMRGYATINGSCSCTGTVYQDVLIRYWHTEGGYSHKWFWNFAKNTTSVPYSGDSCDKMTLGGLAANTESTDYYTLVSGSSGSTSRSMNIGYEMLAHDGKWGNANGANYLRVYQRFYNNIGDTGWVYDDMYIGG